MDREGIGDLVRQDDTLDRGEWLPWLRGLFRHDTPKANLLHRRHCFVEAMTIRFDQPIAEGSTGVRCLGRKAGDEVVGEPADPSPVLPHGEWPWPSKPLPALRDLSSESQAEEGVGLRRRQEVAASPWATRGCQVVAMLRVVQRQFHEPREGEASAGGVDRGVDRLNQGRVPKIGRRGPGQGTGGICHGRGL